MSSVEEFAKVQSVEARLFLSYWSNWFGWVAILSSVLVPVLGIYLSGVSISFEKKRRGNFHAFSYISLIVSIAFLLIHLYLWAEVIHRM